MKASVVTKTKSSAGTGDGQNLFQIWAIFSSFFREIKLNEEERQNFDINVMTK